ncbi:MAG: tRNA pseudouridine(55) synthase TruB [Prevotellaceae bacterium]|nr:tRNA pseudouridine(55) synthase TruB [Prevotellaceae bacterium]
MDFQEGEILCFDKPLTWTSFDVVSKIRWQLTRRLGIKKLKVGHAGTLDPLATGVMVVCTGRATKRIDELQAHVKEYVATLQLGATTPSFDMEMPVDKTYPTGHITEAAVREALTHFLGRIEQVPPAFSACKIDGHRAYDLARKGREVELKPKVLVIDTIELLSFDQTAMQATIRVVCSKGTYIRALARDIGLALDSGAHLIALRRTRVGDIRAEDCMGVEDFPAWLEKVLPKPAGGATEDEQNKNE